MAKELPYFKFYIGEWSDGDITLEDYSLQGLFVNVCCYYWSKDCDLSILNLKKKFRNNESDIQYLIDQNIIKTEGEFASIHFLNEQWKSKEVQVITNRMNGAKGGRPKKDQETTQEKPNGLNSGSINGEIKNPTNNPNETNIEYTIVEERKEKKIVVDEEADFFRQNFKSHNLHRSLVEVEKVPAAKIIELIEIFVDQKNGFDELKGKNFQDLCRNFYYWVPKYLQAQKGKEKSSGQKESKLEQANKLFNGNGN